MRIEAGPVAIVSDIHGEFVDYQAFNAACKVIAYLQPAAVVLNGDIADWYQVSRFDQDPKRRNGLQEEMDKTATLMHQLVANARDAEFYFTSGNHEDRLRRYLWGHPEIANLDCLSLDQLLSLPELGIKFVADKLTFGEFLITHGEAVRSRGGYTAHAMLDRYGCSGVSGHTHRLAQVSRSQWGKQMTWVEGGCLCSLDPEYADVVDWQQGFTILNQDKGAIWPELVQIRNGQAFYDGRVFNA